jgi:predicted transcriptional regulator
MTPKPESDMVRQSLWLNPETLTALKRIGAKIDRPVGWLLRKAAEEFVEREGKAR